MAEFSRLFLALWPDDASRPALARISRLLEAKGLHPVKLNNLHATLVFLGSVDQSTRLLIEHRVADIAVEPFTLTFDQLSYWSQGKLICLTCLQPAIEALKLAAVLNTAVASCGLATDKRPYIPHVTLARHARSLPDIAIEPVAWRAEAFCLAESRAEPDGVYYQVIRRWPFIKTEV